VFGIALSVAACLRSGTRADVAWIVEAAGLAVDDWSEAVVLTPGGGRIGDLAGGALDGQLADLAGRWSRGRLVEIEVTEVDALIAGLSGPGSARCLVAPADTLPPDLWELAATRRPFCLVLEMAEDEVSASRLYTEDDIGQADPVVQDLFAGERSRSAVASGMVVSSFRPVPQLVIVGASPVADAMARLGAELGWQARAFTQAGPAAGVIATLSPLDKVVVTAHDLEVAGSALLAALDSQAGYIGSMGGRRMQENRADWLAYRGVTDLSRVHGPAGLDIGASTPAEIAVSIPAGAGDRAAATGPIT
jgi:xanthine dehydrogenase accessory factor